MQNDTRMTKLALLRRPMVDHFSALRTSGFIPHSQSTLFAFLILAFFSHLSVLSAAEPSRVPDYTSVDSIFSSHCLDCHASKDPEGQLVLESFETLMKGGE